MTSTAPTLSPALGIGAFAEKTLVAAGQATKVDPAARPEAAGLLGCGVMAGLGAAMLHRRGRPGRHASPCSAAAASATPPSPAPAWPAPPRSSPSTSTPRKLELGQGASAPPTPSTPSEDDPVEAIQALTDGNGADVCIEAVGHPEVLEQAFFARDLAGTVVQVGVPNPDDDASSCR